MFHVLPGNFFVPLASPNKIVYWECICKLFSVMDYQLSFGIEREVLVDELQYYFEQSAAAEIVEEDFAGADSRGKQTEFCESWSVMAGLKLRRIRVMYSG